MIKKVLQASNWKKTYYYLKKNGIKAALLAARERAFLKEENYQYIPVSQEELDRQSSYQFQHKILFSILVPVYHTPREYFIEMIESLRTQSYGNFELILADASKDDSLKEIVDQIEDNRIRYIKLNENKGISENTNAALEVAVGDYVGLLDHDDVLTRDALFEMALAIEKTSAQMLYSDEDKGDGEMERFYDVNKKPKFDQDYLWSNNYICHFTVMERSLMQKLKFRKEYDGAQDYDLILRGARTLEHLQIVNIPKVLYHWRCHIDSTAINPQSKLYAYEAGKRAIQDDLNERGILATVRHSKHLGFYRVDYEKDIFECREEVAMVVGPVYHKNRIVKGARDEAGNLLYGGLRKGFSGGHLHRGSVWQVCALGDRDNSIVNQNYFKAFCQGIDLDHMTEEEINLAWANYVKAKNWMILYDPEMESQ